jgi:hypothetical protein
MQSGKKYQIESSCPFISPIVGEQARKEMIRTKRDLFCHTTEIVNAVFAIVTVKWEQKQNVYIAAPEWSNKRRKPKK